MRVFLATTSYEFTMEDYIYVIFLTQVVIIRRKVNLVHKSLTFEEYPKAENNKLLDKIYILLIISEVVYD